MAAQAPDLLITAVTNPPSSLVQGDTFDVTDTTANQGDATAGASTTRYYLSGDGILDEDAELLNGIRAIPELAATADDTGQVSVTVPTDTAPGMYYFVACADDLDAVEEFDETNNCLVSENTVNVIAAVANLLVTTLTAPPASVVQGGSFQVTDTTENLGTASAGASTTRYRLSADNTIDGTDILLTGTRTVPGLAAGGSSTDSVTVTVPLATPTGTYYLGACADDTGAITESSEVDNCLAPLSTITVEQATQFTFLGLFDPWAPPGPGTYSGQVYTSGRVFKINSTLPLKWAYALGGVLVNSATSTPQVHIHGPLAACGSLDGDGTDAVVSYSGPGATTMTYDPITKTWQRNLKLDGAFAADRCYLIQVTDPVTGVTSEVFPIKTKK
jgi:hypothetical protein